MDDDGEDEGDDEDDASLTVAERMSAADAYMMPVFGMANVALSANLLTDRDPDFCPREHSSMIQVLECS